MERGDILLKDGRYVKLGETFKKEDIKGIVLKSGKIISTRIFFNTYFSDLSLHEFPSYRFAGELSLAKRDIRGYENTNLLALNCYDSGLSVLDYLKDDEYIPAVGELRDALLEFGSDRIIQIRETLNLENLVITSFNHFWSSSIRDKDSVWTVTGDGEISWETLGYINRVLPFLNPENIE